MGRKENFFSTCRHCPRLHRCSTATATAKPSQQPSTTNLNGRTEAVNQTSSPRRRNRGKELLERKHSLTDKPKSLELGRLKENRWEPRFSATIQNKFANDQSLGLRYSLIQALKIYGYLFYVLLEISVVVLPVIQAGTRLVWLYPVNTGYLM